MKSYAMLANDALKKGKLTWPLKPKLHVSRLAIFQLVNRIGHIASMSAEAMQELARWVQRDRELPSYFCLEA